MGLAPIHETRSAQRIGAARSIAVRLSKAEARRCAPVQSAECSQLAAAQEWRDKNQDLPLARPFDEYEKAIASCVENGVVVE